MIPLPLARILSRLRPRWVALGLVCCLGVAAVAVLATRPAPPHATFVVRAQPSVTASAPPSPAPVESFGPPASPPAGLEVIDYSPAPAGFPADPAPLSTAPLTAGAHPVEQIAAYDAPGGTPRAYLTPTISGVPLTMPIVERRAGWIAVILPSANRTIAWLPPEGWSAVALHDHLLVQRSTHQLSWYRDGALQQTWLATLGEPATPTPLGRTFVLGRSALPGKVYAGIDVLALGAIPDNINAVPASLRGAHIGIHSWYTDSVLGKSVSNGCVRLPQAAQRRLLSEIVPGTEVIVVD
ncbi:MAG: L,D-transpeptidase family protein [Dactylosporangium sp.]|nr:L,D-transpeptidase family protein [Dactylosporangium sp.]NNJ60261.1 L,D-transpeptidase family protein [Dactylosporangium sp.]